MSAESALALFDRDRETFLEDLKVFLRFQSISAQSDHAVDMADCAKWIAAQLRLAGIEARLVPTARHPVVIADTGPIDNSGAPTLLFYGHYDVQPVGDPKLWTTPPFEPTIRDDAIYARGSADDKGQVMTHLAAVRCWRKSGQPWPARIRFIIEGEEEIGSPNLPDVLRKHAADLACDYVVLSDTAKLNAQTPALAYATRGLVYKEIIVEGPNRDLHSGQYGGAVANPANTLTDILSSLKDGRGRVTIPGFYDQVRPLSPDERRSLDRAGLTDNELLATTGCPAPAGEADYTTAERCTARPTLDVNGLLAGYTGEGAATVIPARATAKVSMRLVADQDPRHISQAFDRAVRTACPPTVQVRIADHSHCAAYLAPTDSPGMRAAAAALTASFGKPPVFTREGGTLPILPLFKQILGADSIMLGFAVPDCNLHSPNEFFHLSDFHNGTRCILHFLSRMGEINITH
ncbi:MAG TPA: dipeptidase [Phycisphaerae bacterium]|nr:dipeptidase [Phycisphaerae bacterium]